MGFARPPLAVIWLTRLKRCDVTVTPPQATLCHPGASERRARRRRRRDVEVELGAWVGNVGVHYHFTFVS